jgi:integrase/recombinase XerD
MALNKQAKILTDKNFKLALKHLSGTRQPERNLTMFLLSVKAGLRAKEISFLKWEMLLDSEGSFQDHLSLPNSASKGKSSGRVIPLNNDLKEALQALYSLSKASSDDHVIMSERKAPVSAQVVVNWFQKLYKDLNFIGCSSHSGRRTFITQSARKISSVGGSLKDIQELAGHSSLSTTQRYIEANEQAKKAVVNL